MIRTSYRLALALALSLLLHIAPFVSELIRSTPQRITAPPIQAELRHSANPAPATQVPLELPKPKPSAEETGSRVATKSAKSPSTSWLGEIRRQFRKQNELGQFYPAEAIARGLEGEATIFMIINEQGQVAAARVEQSSGLPILDDAALRAVRALHSLPADAPRETLLPVRFRLN